MNSIFISISFPDEKWLVAVVKPLISTFVKELSMFNETAEMRYISKHDLNGRVLDIDQKSVNFSNIFVRNIEC